MPFLFLFTDEFLLETRSAYLLGSFGRASLMINSTSCISILPSCKKVYSGVKLVTSSLYSSRMKLKYFYWMSFFLSAVVMITLLLDPMEANWVLKIYLAVWSLLA